MLESQYIAMVLLSMDRGDNQGAQLIRTILKQAPQTICIALTVQDRASDVIRILEAGAFDCFTRPIRDWPRFRVCTQAVSIGSEPKCEKSSGCICKTYKNISR